jgi:hypothetical protein
MKIWITASSIDSYVRVYNDEDNFNLRLIPDAYIIIERVVAKYLFNADLPQHNTDEVLRIEFSALKINN